MGTAYEGFNRDEPDLVPGEVVAYRMFRLTARDTIVSLTAPIDWAEETKTAGCRVVKAAENVSGRSLREMPAYVLVRVGDGNPHRLRIEGHHAPEPDCTCGFYAYYSPDKARVFKETWSEVDPHRYVLAAVACSGRCVLGTKGVRAEKMRILGVSVETVLPEDLNGMWNRMFMRRLTVVRLSADRVYMTDEDLIRAFPPPDPTTLVPDADLTYRNDTVKLAVKLTVTSVMCMTIVILLTSPFLSLFFPDDSSSALEFVTRMLWGAFIGFVWLRKGEHRVTRFVLGRRRKKALRDFRERYPGAVQT